MISNRSQASIDQSVNLPDYFSCSNCYGRADWRYCQELRREHLCAKEMLGRALASGAVEIHVVIPSGLPGPSG